MVNTVEYQAWYDMLRRCINPKDTKYKYYGAKGIRVHARWATFTNFLNDLGKRPGKGYSLGRIDNTGNYEPGNVRWETWEQQKAGMEETAFKRLMD